MKNILILSTSSLTTGAVFHIEQCIKSLDNIGDVNIYLHLNSMLNLSSNPKVNIQAIPPCKVNVINILYILFFIPFYSYLKKIDLIYSPWGISPIFSRGKVILGAHNPLPLMKVGYFSGGFIFSLLHKISLKKADFIKIPSKSFAEFLINKYDLKKERFKVIYHGVNIEEWRNKANDYGQFNSYYFIFWSWFHETKGLEELMLGFKYFLDLHPNNEKYKLVLAGRFSSPAYEIKIIKLINKLNINNRIEFFFQPSFSELVGLICKCGGIIFPFRFETFGYPYVEARVFNKPIAVAKNLVSDEITEGQCYEFDLTSIAEISKAFNFLKSKRNSDSTYSISNKFLANYEVKDMSDFLGGVLWG